MQGTIVERLYKDATDIYLSVTLDKMTKKVDLQTVVSRIGRIGTSIDDTTQLIRKMRGKRYG